MFTRRESLMFKGNKGKDPSGYELGYKCARTTRRHTSICGCARRQNQRSVY